MTNKSVRLANCVKGFLVTEVFRNEQHYISLFCVVGVFYVSSSGGEKKVGYVVLQACPWWWLNKGP